MLVANFVKAIGLRQLFIENVRSNGHGIYHIHSNTDLLLQIIYQKIVGCATDKAANKLTDDPTFLHSDMGSQYTSIAYEGLLKRYLIRHSYSKPGYPYDNDPLEAFHSLLKREFIFQTRFTRVRLQTLL